MSKPLKVLSTVLGILIFLVGIALFLYFGFTVRKVNITGNDRYDDTFIESSLLNDKYSWNGLYVYLKYKFKKPESIPFVDKIEVSLKDLHTVNIRVYEKKLIGYAYIAETGQYAYFDKDGIVLELSTSVLEDVVFVEGIKAKKPVLFEKLQVENKSIFKNLLKITKTLEKYNLLPEKIICNDTQSISLKYESVIVEFGGTSLLNEKVVRLEKILPELKGMKGILHLENYSETNTDIIFEKEEKKKKKK